MMSMKTKATKFTELNNKDKDLNIFCFRFVNFLKKSILLSNRFHSQIFYFTPYWVKPQVKLFSLFIFNSNFVIESWKSFKTAFVWFSASIEGRVNSAPVPEPKKEQEEKIKDCPKKTENPTQCPPICFSYRSCIKYIAPHPLLFMLIMFKEERKFIFKFTQRTFSWKLSWCNLLKYNT